MANSGLGAVHGLAGVIGGVTPAAHGAICGSLLGPVIAMNRARASGQAAHRLDEVSQILGQVFQCSAAQSPVVLTEWSRAAGLPGLAAQGLSAKQHPAVAEAALLSSSMKANPAPLAVQDILLILSNAG